MPLGWEVAKVETPYSLEVEVVEIWVTHPDALQREYFRVPYELGNPEASQRQDAETVLCLKSIA